MNVGAVKALLLKEILPDSSNRYYLISANVRFSLFSLSDIFNRYKVITPGHTSLE